MNVLDFRERKRDGRPISITTCYDFWSARILDASKIDAILVGDSLAMVMHGHDTTVSATVDLMAPHVEAVRRGTANKFSHRRFAFPEP